MPVRWFVVLQIIYTHIIDNTLAESPFVIDFTCSNRVFDISSLSCTACQTSSSNLSASLDQSSCLLCDASAHYNSSSSQCKCTAYNEYLSDLQATKICSQCPTQHTVTALDGADSNSYACKLCEAPKIINATANYQCMCPSSSYVTTKSGDDCVPAANATYITTNYGLSTSVQVAFKNIDASDIVTIASSALFDHYFLDAAVNCNIHQDIKACQILANLCALTMYNKLHNACLLFMQTASAIDTVSNSFSNWKQSMPFLFYSDHSVLSSTALASSISNIKLDDKLHIILVKYSMNGSLIGSHALSDELHYFCRDDINNNERHKFTQIGYNIQLSCTFDLSSIFNATTDTSTSTASYDDLFFYDPYLYIAAQNKYYPLPVYIENIDNHDGYKLVRRFFIADALSSNRNVLRYLQSAIFTVTVYDQIYIHPPLITLTYGMKRLSQMSDADEKLSVISFEARTLTDLSSFKISVIILFVICLILVLSLWMYQVYLYQRVQFTQNVINTDLRWFLRVLGIGFGVSSHLFFWLLFVISAYCYLAFKGNEGRIKFLLPAEDDALIVAFKALLVYCFVAKFIHVAMLIMDQCSVDIFLIDWERPKGNIMALIQQQQFMQQRFQPPLSSASHSAHNDTNNMHMNIISCWRKLFVANEWNEMSIYRNISPQFMFFVFLSFMVGLQYEYFSLQKPVALLAEHEIDVIAVSIVYKFVVCAFFFLLVFTVAYLYCFFVNDRILGSDGFMDLIDLTCLANISIFVLDTRYHGFYIHGKSIYQHADTSLQQINQNIENERKQLCKARGLVADKDVFEIFVSTQFRQQYDKIYREVLQFEMSKLKQNLVPNNNFFMNQNARANESTVETDNNLLLSKQLIESSKLLSMFLSDFIEKTCPHQWEHRELMGAERIFGALPDLSIERNSIFYEDVLHKFKSKLMYAGLQYDVTLLLILTFCFADFFVLSKHNSTISIFITYLVDYMLVHVRSYFGERNLSRKTLIDKKFLI